MTKKIKLSDLKVKSSVVELSQNERKATKGGYIQKFKGGFGKGKIAALTVYIADTQVDIRLHDKSSESNNTSFTAP